MKLTIANAVAGAFLITIGLLVPIAVNAQKAPPPAAKSDDAPRADIAGRFEAWVLVCPPAKKAQVKPDGGATEDEDDDVSGSGCRLVQQLVESKTKKQVFRLMVALNEGGVPFLLLTAPAGVDLARGIEFSPDSNKFYRAAFRTCRPAGCRAVLLLRDGLRKEMAAAKAGSITVYALNGRAVRAAASMAGFAEGLAELQKRREAAR